MKWRTFKDEKMEVDWPNIEKALASVGTVQKVDILDINHYPFTIDALYFSENGRTLWNGDAVISNTVFGQTHL
jgi:hypothetical protein